MRSYCAKNMQLSRLVPPPRLVCKIRPRVCLPVHPMAARLPLVVGLVGGSAALVYYLRARRRQTSRRALDLLRVVDSGVLEAELERRRVGSHVFNTTVRPLHALRSQLLNVICWWCCAG